jgi:general secretion pathway protein A
MYESHFGFSGAPFQLNPDPAFYFDSRGHSNALAYLKFGAHQGEGFIVVTGEIGAGKTTLVRTLLEGLNPDQVVAAQVVSTQLESNELLQAILMAFGIPSSTSSKAHLIANLEAYLTALAAKGRRALLIIDEAQNLKHEAVEELRMLSNFQLGKYGLLQSFLVGQPELRGLLQSKSMEQLRQRVIASCHLGPLDPAETRAYVEHRLKRVGWNGSMPSLSHEVLDRVHYWTGGVPRKINRLCNRLLLGAFLANVRILSAAMVDETALELRNEIGEAVTTGTPAPPGEKATVAPSQEAPRPQPASQPPAVTPPPPAPEFSTQRAAASAMDSLPDAVASPAAEAAAPATAARAPAAVEVRKDVPETAPAPPSAAAAPQPLTAPATAVGPATIAAPAPIVWREHDATRLPHPMLCLVDSAADYLKAGILAQVFKSFPSLPQVVAVHVGAESDIVIDDMESLGLPLPCAGLHLGVAPAPFAQRSARILEAFDAVVSETAPQAVMILGSSDADFACAVLAHKRGIRLLRTGSGSRDADVDPAGDSNSVLIEKMADVLYTDSTESLYALYREGIRLDRVHSVGSLSREAIDTALASTYRSESAGRPATVAGTLPTGSEYALVTVDPRATSNALPIVDALARWSLEMPLVWLLPTAALRVLESSRALEHVRQAKIRLVAEEGIRQGLALVRGASCVVSGRDGPWLEESQLLGIATRVLDNIDEPLASGVGSLRDWMRDHAGTSQAPPEYWNTGTATRIAGHLVALFARANAGSQSGASTTHAISVT